MTVVLTAQPMQQLTSTQTPALSFVRGCAVEARKLFNTRSGKILTATAAVLAGVFSGGQALLTSGEVSFGSLAAMATLPVNTIVMVMAILLISSEFAARTAASTFVLDPNRGRVLGAKLVVVVGLAVGATLLGVLAAALAGLVAPLLTGNATVWTISLSDLAVLVASTTFTALAGFAWALWLRNAPAPIVVLLVWPTLSMLLSSISAGVANVIGYFDLQPVFGLAQGEPNAGPQVLTSAIWWIVLPLAAGLWRTLRNDI